MKKTTEKADIAIHRILPVLGTTLLVSLCCTGLLHACSVPVFRYALERWPVDAYRLVVFHEGDLSEAQQELQSRLGSYSEIGYGRPPLVLEWVDVNATIPEHVSEVWHEVRDTAVPLMVLLPPAMGGEDLVLWTAPLSAASVEQLVESPVRGDLAQRLIDGQTAVWLLLRSGDREKDDAVAAALEEGLRAMESSLKLPHELDPADTQYDTALSEDIELKIAFSILPINLDDPCETLLASIFNDIVTTEEGQALPAVVPVFGRGRALVFLDEADIELDTIAEICHFLVGPCSCQVKQLNPGVDLPILVDWDARIIGMMGDEEIPTSLLVPGVMALADTNAPPIDIPNALDGPETKETLTAAAPAEDEAVGIVHMPVEPNQPLVMPAPRGRLRHRLWLLALVSVAVVVAGSVFLMKRSRGA